MRVLGVDAAERRFAGEARRSRMRPRLDLAGQTIAGWRVGAADHVERGPSVFSVTCVNCGATRKLRAGLLNGRHAPACQCSPKRRGRPPRQGPPRPPESRGAKAIDMTGARSGSFVVIERAGSDGIQATWRARCEACGAERVIRGQDLRRGHAPRCATCAERAADALVGQRFGWLRVVERVGAHRYRCECSCGNTTTVRGAELTRKVEPTRSCGCRRNVVAGARFRRHGRTNTPEHAAYRQARYRCENPISPKWGRYGGRGIRFLFPDFESFFAALGLRPSPAHSLDRIDVDGDYQPDNVRWASKKEQRLNQEPRNGSPAPALVAE